MKRGRPPKLEPRVRINIYLREDLYLKFILLNYDQEKQKATFGAFSDFVNEALAEYILKREFKQSYLEDKDRIAEDWKQRQ